MEASQLNPDQRKFLADELFALVLQGTLQRSPTYKEKTSDRRKADFKQALRSALESMARNYATGVSEETHVSNIQRLAQDLSCQFHDCLFQDRFRIGSAQKALSLYLKYLWCLGEIPRLPHCPFDSSIIQKLPVDCRVNWTELDNVEQYRSLVRGAIQVANGRALAEWELLEYNRA